MKRRDSRRGARMTAIEALKAAHEKIWGGRRAGSFAEGAETETEAEARLWRELDVLHREIAALLRATASALRRGDDEKSDPPGIRPWHAAARLDKIAAQIAGAASSQQRAKRKG